MASRSALDQVIFAAGLVLFILGTTALVLDIGLGMDASRLYETLRNDLRPGGEDPWTLIDAFCSQPAYPSLPARLLPGLWYQAWRIAPDQVRAGRRLDDWWQRHPGLSEAWELCALEGGLAVDRRQHFGEIAGRDDSRARELRALTGQLTDQDRLASLVESQGVRAAAVDPRSRLDLAAMQQSNQMLLDVMLLGVDAPGTAAMVASDDQVPEGLPWPRLFVALLDWDRLGKAPDMMPAYPAALQDQVRTRERWLDLLFARGDADVWARAVSALDVQHLPEHSVHRANLILSQAWTLGAGGEPLAWLNLQSADTRRLREALLADMGGNRGSFRDQALGAEDRTRAFRVWAMYGLVQDLPAGQEIRLDPAGIDRDWLRAWTELDPVRLGALRQAARLPLAEDDRLRSGLARLPLAASLQLANRARVALAAGDAILAIGELEQALKYLATQALGFDRNSQSPYAHWRADLLALLARAREVAGDGAGAEQLWQELEQLDPGHPGLLDAQRIPKTGVFEE